VTEMPLLELEPCATGYLIVRVTKTGELSLYQGLTSAYHRKWTRKRLEAKVLFDDVEVALRNMTISNKGRTPGDQVFAIPTHLYSAIVHHAISGQATSDRPGRDTTKDGRAVRKARWANHNLGR
jgi:hypothetical protein